MATPLFTAGAPDVAYLVDLSSYLLRAYHAVAPLSSPSGEPTHAVHGTVTMLERLYRERRPHLLGIFMDAGRKTFRKDIFPEYKAHRPPAPDDLKVQIGRAEQIARASGLAVFKQDGVEADDLIASATRKLTAADKRVVIVGADKDLMQLVSERVLLWDTLRSKVFGPEEVSERFGVSPGQLGDLLALTGDSSDNIPGVPSVGPKTAAALLTDYGDLDGIFSHLEQIKRKKLKEVLEANQDNARLSRRLVELKSDCDVDTSDAHLAFGSSRGRDEATLEALYEDLGFTRQLAQLRAGTTEIQKSQTEKDAQGATRTSRDAASDDPKAATLSPDPQPLGAAARGDAGVTLARAEPRALTPEIVSSEEHLERVLDEIRTGAWALEGFSTLPTTHRGPLIALALTGGTRSYYIPLAHRYVGMPSQLPTGPTLERILRALGTSETLLSTHHLKRLMVLCSPSVAPGDFPVGHDTLLASYLLDPEQAHQIEAFGARFGVAVMDFDSISKEGRRRRPLDELPCEDASRYAASRGEAILAAAAAQRELLAESHLGRLLSEVEAPLSRLLAEMEIHGVLIDADILHTIGKRCEAELRSLELEAHRAVGKEFNVNSPRQLETILFDELGLKPIKRTKTSRSTDAQTLEALTEQHPLPGLILQHRQIAKLKGTYIDALPALVDPGSGRVHSSWEQAIAATGRISATDPNLQNIPIRSELGRSIRAAFVAPPGHLLLSADYSQIELRVLAHLSGDALLVEAFNTGQDVHTRTAMEIFEVTEPEVTREMRTRAKAVNFGVIYGQGEGGLSKALGIERKVAQSFIAAYFRRYEGVRRYMDETLERARQGEAVQSILGRRRMVSDIKSGNRARRLAAERIAMNMPIQGSAADILKLAMLKLKVPPTPGCRMVLTVHDELVFEVPRSEAEQASDLVRRAMEGAYTLKVPLTVSVGTAANWKDAH